MTIETTQDDVTILAPDFSLLRKIGGERLDYIVSSTTIQRAENVIIGASNELYSECRVNMREISAIVPFLKANETNTKIVHKIVSLAFAVKVKSAQGGYDLIAALAKSLLSYCEEKEASSLMPSTITVITWHVDSINELMHHKMRGMGGEVGQAILLEIEKLNHRNDPQPAA